MLLVSGVTLFLSKIGIGLDDITKYYHGDEALYISAKSFYGLLESSTPHLGAMGLFIMVIGHFILFVSHKYRKGIVPIFIALFISAFLDIVSGFFVSRGFLWFSILKQVSFITFISFSIYVTFIVFKESYLSLNSDQKNENLL